MCAAPPPQKKTWYDRVLCTIRTPPLSTMWELTGTGGPFLVFWRGMGKIYAENKKTKKWRKTSHAPRRWYSIERNPPVEAHSPGPHPRGFREWSAEPCALRTRRTWRPPNFLSHTQQKRKAHLAEAEEQHTRDFGGGLLPKKMNNSPLFAV